jgi:hypothetical protein
MEDEKTTHTIEFKWGKDFQKNQSFETSKPLPTKSMGNKSTFFFQPTENKKWYEFRKMDRREFGYTAIVALLAGGIFSSLGGSITLDIFGGVLSLAGLACGIIWIILAIRSKIKK